MTTIKQNHKHANPRIRGPLRRGAEGGGEPRARAGSRGAGPWPPRRDPNASCDWVVALLIQNIVRDARIDGQVEHVRVDERHAWYSATQYNAAAPPFTPPRIARPYRRPLLGATQSILAAFHPFLHRDRALVQLVVVVQDHLPLLLD